MKFTLIIALTMLICPFTSVDAAWQVKFGGEDAQVNFRAPISDEDFPEGPHSLRVVSGNLWLLDSAGAKILVFGQANRLVRHIILPTISSKVFYEDFAVQLSEDGKEAVAVVTTERYSGTVIKCSLDGTELLKFKPANSTQLDEVAIAPDGRIYVGDFGRAGISVFSPQGKFERSVPWQFSGFATDQQSNLHMLDYNDQSGHQHVVLSPSGKQISRTTLGFAEMQNPRIWEANSNGVFVSFVPPSGDPTKQTMMRINKEGKAIAKTDFSNPYFIYRYLDVDGENIWIISANYFEAPSSDISVRPLVLK